MDYASLRWTGGSKGLLQFCFGVNLTWPASGAISDVPQSRLKLAYDLSAAARSSNIRQGWWDGGRYDAGWRPWSLHLD